MSVMGSPVVRALMAVVSIGAWVALAALIAHLARAGWSWGAALVALIALDVACETGFAAWRGRAPDASLLFYLF